MYFESALAEFLGSLFPPKLPLGPSCILHQTHVEAQSANVVNGGAVMFLLAMAGCAVNIINLMVLDSHIGHSHAHGEHDHGDTCGCIPYSFPPPFPPISRIEL